MSLTRTMGVQQVPGGLDVAVMEFGGVEPTVIYAARVSSEHNKALPILKSLVAAHNVQRGLVSSHPDGRLAALLIQEVPSVFGLEGGSSQTGPSLAEIAYRRIEAMNEPVIASPPAPVQVASIEHVDDRTLLVDVYVPPGEPMPTHAIIPLEGAEPLERPDGARILTQKIGLHEIGLTQAGPALVGGARSVWSLSPRTKLPTKGWTLVVSLYAGDGSLMHEQVLTEGQMMGLANLVAEATRVAEVWLSPQPGRAAPLPVGPYTARFEIFAGQTSVYSAPLAPGVVEESAFASQLAGAGVTVAAWIEANAVDVEAAHPGINIPAPGPYDMPDVSTDTYDYPT